MSYGLLKGNASYINRLNKIKVLNLIREKKEISRAEIAKITKLSAPTITRIVNSLINNERLVEKVGTGKVTFGRPPIMVKFMSENNYVIGIDLGTTNIRGIISNLNSEIISEVQTPTCVELGTDSVMKKVEETILELINREIGKKNKIFGVGMAVAGLINREKEIVEFSPDFNWNDVEIKKKLSKRINIPIIFDNVTRVMALGELWYGIGKKYKNFICVNLGYGIGSGIIIDGKPLYGTHGMSGEFGHITLEKDSKVYCKCGNYGCLEALASGRGIAQSAQDEIENGQKSILRNLCDGDVSSITAELVAEAAKRGDEVAQRVFRNATEYIGIGIADLINLFDPQAVVIGGGVAQAGDILFDSVRESVNRRVICRKTNNCKILHATFGMNAAVMGAVSLILNEILNLNVSV